MTDLCRRIENGELKEGFWFAGDNAYEKFIPTGSFLCPFKGKDLTYDQSNYNFFFRQLRIIAECALGMLVARFGCLWKPLRFGSIKRNTIVFCVLCKLHNLITDYNISNNITSMTNQALLSSASDIGVYEGRRGTKSCKYYHAPEYDDEYTSPRGIFTPNNVQYSKMRKSILRSTYVRKVASSGFQAPQPFRKYCDSDNDSEKENEK